VLNILEILLAQALNTDQSRSFFSVVLLQEVHWNNIIIIAHALRNEIVDRAQLDVEVYQQIVKFLLIDLAQNANMSYQSDVGVAATDYTDHVLASDALFHLVQLQDKPFMRY